MKNVAWLGGLAACLLLTGCSLEAKPSAADWKSFQAPQGRYSVFFPGVAQTFPAEGVTNYGVESPGGHLYMVSESESQQMPDPAASLAALRNAEVGANKSLLDKEYVFLGLPGREFAFIDAGGNAMHVRAFINGDRVYQLMALAPQARYEASSADREKFFDSFKLLAAVTPPGSDASNPQAVRPEWQAFSPPEGRYAVLLPGTAQKVPGDGVANYGVELPGGFVYLVSESESKQLPDPAASLVAMRNAIVGDNKALIDKEYAYRGLPGHEVYLVDAEGGAMHSRFFINGDRIYQLITIAPQASYEANAAEREKFFDSFKLLSADEANDADENGQSETSSSK